jgi:diguanylate cyclase (GGDEF)-like protein/PAS domain S-box-containing protein
MVAAFGAAGTLVPMPDSVPLRGHSVFEGRTALDLLVADDQRAVIEGWARAQDEPVVRLEVHFLASPDEIATMHFLDVRAEHGVHAIVLETRDQQIVSKSSEVLAQLRRGIAHAKKDAVAVFLEVDEATTALLGWTADELVGRSTIEFVHPDDVERSIDSWMAMRAGAGNGRLRVRYRHADGHHIWLEVTNENHLDDPELGCIVSEMVDISAEISQLEELRARERLLARLAEALPLGICHLRPDREVVYANEPLVELLGPIDSVDALLHCMVAADRYLVEIAVDNALQGHPGRIDVGVLHDRDVRQCELTFRTLLSDSGSVDGVIICASDVTDHSRLRAELEHRASHDALTGCLNRAATVATLERTLRDAEQVAVAYIDLDQFKPINDELGHATGDELLRVAAARLRSVTRIGDCLGRLGGDEFVVICPRGVGDIDVEALVERLTEAVQGDVVFARQRIPLRASVGATIALAGELDAEAVLHRADTAMYAAKRLTRRAASNVRAIHSAQ